MADLENKEVEEETEECIDWAETQKQGKIVKTKRKKEKKEVVDYNLFIPGNDYHDYQETTYVRNKLTDKQVVEGQCASMGIMWLVSLMIPTITVSCFDDKWVPLTFIFLLVPSFIFLYIGPLLECGKRSPEVLTAVKEVNNKQLLFLGWSIFYTLVPFIPIFKFEKENAKYYIFLVGMFVAVYIIDEFFYFLFLGLKRKYKSARFTIDIISIIVSTIALWAWGAIISGLLFSNTMSIVIFDICLVLPSFALAFINYYLSKRRCNNVDCTKVEELIMSSKKAYLILLTISLIFAAFWVGLAYSFIK